MIPAAEGVEFARTGVCVKVKTGTGTLIVPVSELVDLLETVIAIENATETGLLRSGRSRPYGYAWLASPVDSFKIAGAINKTLAHICGGPHRHHFHTQEARKLADTDRFLVEVLCSCGLGLNATGRNASDAYAEMQKLISEWAPPR